MKNQNNPKSGFRVLSGDVEGTVEWKSPSNIALIKYWGKKPVQLPQNPSLSFTLSAAHSITSIQYRSRLPTEPWIDFYFEGKREKSFGKRIEKYLGTLSDEMPFLNQLSLTIRSVNSFPHSSGIASSASGMSALALCLCEMEELFSTGTEQRGFFQRASYIARLGSGSASRSVFPTLALWGSTPLVSESSDEYAIPYENIHVDFMSFNDDILIVDSGKKSVSSSSGHALMNGNPFSTARYQQANDHLKMMISILESGDLMTFGEIVETEALTLHALMMCSKPSFILLKPKTLTIIEEIRQFRKETKIPVFFTLDAGPNVHILYPERFSKNVKDFIREELLKYSENNMIIYDKTGKGPQNMKL